MRISTAHAYDATVERLSQRQSELSEAQLRLTSGKRVARASDDPISAARAERALAGVSRASADLRSVDASRAAMTQIEGALGDAGDLLQAAREAIVGGGNASYDDSQRKMLADHIRGLRSQLLAVANRATARVASCLVDRARARRPSSTRRVACSTSAAAERLAPTAAAACR